MRTVRAWAAPLVLALLLAGALLGASPASAHAVLVSSTPSDGSTLRASPAQVHLVFDEHIQLVPGTAIVLSADGHKADAGTAHLDASGTGIDIPLLPALPKGSYLVTWRVVSADTHIVSGSISFGIRQAATPTSLTGSAPLSSLDVVDRSAVGISYLGVIGAFGIPAVALLLWPTALTRGRVRLLQRAGCWALLVTAAVAFLLQGPRAVAAGWGGVVRFDDIGQTVHSEYGVALLLRLVLLAALLSGSRELRRSEPRRIAVAAVFAVGVFVTIALGGHAAAGAHVWAALPAAVLHLAAMAVWLGGLALMVAAPQETAGAKPADVAALRRWSRLASSAVVVLIVSGAYQAWRQLQPLPSLWSTRYGVTLLVKVGVVLLMLVAALAAQRALMRARPSVVTVRRSVRMEAALSLAVVGITALLVSEAPASATYGPAVTLTAPLGPDRLVVHVADTRRGPQQITVTPVEADGRPLPLQALDAHLSSPQSAVAALDLHLVRGPSRTWHTVGAVAPLAGVWTLTFDVSLDQASGYATAVSYHVW